MWADDEQADEMWGKGKWVIHNCPAHGNKLTRHHIDYHKTYDRTDESFVNYNV